MTTAAAQFAERQREFETVSAQTTAAKDAIDLRLHEAEATLERIHAERAAEAIAVAAQRTQLESALATATANGETLDRRLAEVTNALHTAEELVASERVASDERATERQAEFDARLSLELGTRQTIDQALAATRQDLLQTEAALRDATAQHTKEMTSAATHLTEQQTKYETRLAEVMTAREIVSQQLHDTEATLARIRQESDAKAIASAERLSQRESDLAAASAAGQVLERRLVDTQTALNHAEALTLAERTATIQQSAQRQAEFDAQLAREVEARNIVLRDLAETRMAAEQTQQALLGQCAALTTEMRQLEVRLTQQLARERADYEGKLAAANENVERIRQAKEIELQRLGDDYAVVRQTLDQVRADALQTLERVGSEHAAELVRINALVAERDGQLKDQAARLKAVMQDFEETKSHRDLLQIKADRVPQLTNQLEARRAESRLQFDGSPFGILRCSGAGVLQEANRALITALGYRTVDALRALDSAAAVFESPDDFRWLIEHCERTPSESIDCIWKKKDGSRLTMRLRALRLSADVVDIVAEDVTTLRAVEERLRRAQRMEAVGRLASEVADTCDIILRNVSQDGQRWLTTVGSNAVQRHQGELILGEVTRAASFLRQLSVYGEKQTSALTGIDVNTVLRDLAPVLKRVAGDDIELVLPKKVFALNVDVDVDIERVERMLVNIVAYGRTRMPSGGRLIIDLARVVVDRDFITKYPNVRPGAHALISVTEVRTAAAAEWPKGIREAVEATAIGATSERPRVDLGVLPALIGDCGGHLWMNAEPGGEMEVKIHLPLRSADTSGIAGVVRSALGRSVSALFQS
jgi:PAS domain-containing protein